MARQFLHFIAVLLSLKDRSIPALLRHRFTLHVMTHLSTVIFILGSMISNETHAQAVWAPRSDLTSVRVEYISPQFKSMSPGYTYTYRIFTLSGRVPLGHSFAALIEVPFIWETMRNPFQDNSKNDIGNTYFGVEIGSSDSWIFGEIGFRPIMRQEMNLGGFGGYYGDFDRFEAHFREIVSYQLAINAGSIDRTGFAYRVRVGPTIVAPENGEQTTFIDYGARVGFDNGSVTVFGGLTGRASTKEGSGKKAFHHAGLDVGYRFRGIRPAFIIRWPLDKEINEILTQSIGAGLTVEW